MNDDVKLIVTLIVAALMVSFGAEQLLHGSGLVVGGVAVAVIGWLAFAEVAEVRRRGDR